MADTGDLARNLHYLASHYRSVAEVCRRIGINRQQFNKYLSGAARPSLHNFKRLADFFGVEESELLLSHQDFVRLVLRRPLAADLPEPLRLFLHQSQRKFAASQQAMARYCGLYHAYFRSPAWPQGILCNLYAITTDGVQTYVKTVERLTWAHKAKKDVFVHKYQGLALHDGNRIYLFESQPALTACYSMIVLYPSNRSRISLLPGLVTSVTGGVSRAPYASRIVLERLGEQADFRVALARCGVYRLDSEEIDEEIKDRIDNALSDPSGTLTASEY